MTEDEIAEWQALAPTRAVLGFFQSALKQWELHRISPTDSTPDEFWADSVKAEITREVFKEFTELLKDPKALAAEMEANSAE